MRLFRFKYGKMLFLKIALISLVLLPFSTASANAISSKSTPGGQQLFHTSFTIKIQHVNKLNHVTPGSLGDLCVGEMFANKIGNTAMQGWIQLTCDPSLAEVAIFPYSDHCSWSVLGACIQWDYAKSSYELGQFYEQAEIRWPAAGGFRQNVGAGQLWRFRDEVQIFDYSGGEAEGEFYVNVQF